MTDRNVIHSMGRHDWQLAVCGRDVTASIHHPAIDSVVITTAEFGFTAREASRDGCSPEQVVAAYCKRTRCEASFDDLLERVRAATADALEVAA